MADTGLESRALETSRHDPKFYIEDGNIVLAAKDSDNNTRYFRLHRSILLEHSPVFKDMFAMPPPPTIAHYDGVPLVEMPDDADSLRNLIVLLYDSKCVFTFKMLRPLISMSRSIPHILDGEDFALDMLEPTRLARKYQVDWISTMVACQLEKRWPTTVEGWDSIAQDEALKWTRNEVGAEFWEPHWADQTLKLQNLPEPVSSILLARECDVSSILPFAFLHLLRLPLDFDPAAPDFQPLPWAFPERSYLSQADLHRLALARERIGRWFSRQSERNTSADCGSGMRCEATTLLIWCKIAKDVGRDGNVLQAHRWTQDNIYLKDICPACKGKLETEIHALRHDFASQLSRFFQLDDAA
ncbi:hypothetical protein DFH09DRAFT_910240 [Mycena vulgaris]|nr:hypothetical protein DFH09DRAFT_910240 [Mycena vulgaris]